MSNILREKSFSFATKIVSLCKRMDEQRSYTLSKQLLRSGTSVGANIEESLQAQSRADFISKLSISLKEAVETEYWLRLLVETKTVSEDLGPRIIEIKEIEKILTASIKTAKTRK